MIKLITMHTCDQDQDVTQTVTFNLYYQCQAKIS